jgi:hypothetical protein
MWMKTPPGEKNCHFLNITSDEAGPNGISIQVDKPFDEQAQWQYLGGPLETKVDSDIAARIWSEHEKLPVLFQQITANTRINYPFKYDCGTGKYLDSTVEESLRKNIQQGNGKARATGFAIPVLGRLPKIFADTYLLKCKLQLALRLLDMGTENSLRICIGKPCGGVRPLTVGHDNNVFLNGIAQQAIQVEIANLKILPENLCSYQRGKGCSDATIVSCVTKEVAIQSDEYYLAEISDDAGKMFDRLYIKLQVALLQLAGVGKQGFAEWQYANLTRGTNRLITDIFVTTLNYQCGLPQGNGFSVEAANLYALFLLIWWNMDPLHPGGTTFESPRHAFSLTAEGSTKHVSSLAYVDDTTKFVAVLEETYPVSEFFDIIQGYCNLVADLSLVIKMGKNVKKCSICLYNVPKNTEIPEFYSIAWSFDAQGPVKGIIETTVMQQDNESINLICVYQINQRFR